MNEKFDVIVIGGGPGGTPAAIQLAASGKKVLLAEQSGNLGGSCLFVDCIPSKIIKHKSDVFNAGKATVSHEDPAQTWQTIRHEMDFIISKRSQSAVKQITQMPITFVTGLVRFVSHKEVEINNIRYWFDKAIIATGTHSFVPPFKGNEVKEVLTSEMLFQLPALPLSLLIIGGGATGIEIAQMFAKLKVKCVILETMPGLLSEVVEPEFAEGITKKLQSAGVDIYTQVKVESINKIGNPFQTLFTDANGKSQMLITEKVLAITGKMPSIESLNLQAAGIRFEQNGIVVNEYLETTTSGIYATGDVVLGSPDFAHTATYEAHIAAVNILRGNIKKVNFAKNAWVLFSDPEIAVAGVTEAQAVKAGFNVIVGMYDYKKDAAAQISGDTFGFLKFIVNKNTEEILGVHLFINGAASLIGEAALIVSAKMTLMDVIHAIHPHPTLTEAFGALALKMFSSHKFSEPLDSE